MELQARSPSHPLSQQLGIVRTYKCTYFSPTAVTKRLEETKVQQFSTNISNTISCHRRRKKERLLPVKLLKERIPLFCFKTTRNFASKLNHPVIFLSNCIQFVSIIHDPRFSNNELLCERFRSIGLPVNTIVTKNLNDEEKYPVHQLLIDDEFGPLGPGGIRALMTAVMGSGAGMKGGPYKLLNSLRMWRANCSDDGAAAIVSYLVIVKLLSPAERFPFTSS